MTESMRDMLRKLRLSGLAQSLDVRLQEATANGLNHQEFLELALQDELAVRADRLFDRRVNAACFRDLKTLENFDWTFNTSLKKKQVFDLATCRFIVERRRRPVARTAGHGHEPSRPGHRLPGEVSVS